MENRKKDVVNFTKYLITKWFIQQNYYEEWNLKAQRPNKDTVKPVLKATSEQRPPVNNDRPKSPALLNLVLLNLVFWTNLWTTAILWTTATF
jgi:hypothetical protein